MADTSKYTISLSAPATLTATLGAGKINVNDYTLTVEEAESGVKLTLTRGSKTETVFIPDGAKGDKGDKGDTGAKGDPGAQGPKGDPGSDANVTAENIQSALGYVPVKDVQVAGSSVLEDGVAKVPIASDTVAGVVKTNSWEGTRMDSYGRVLVFPSTNNHVNTRVSNTVLTPTNMDYAVKAAMCDGKGAAWTAAEQKAARERMGVDKAYELIEEITLEEDAFFERYKEPDGTDYNFREVELRAEFPACDKTGNLQITYWINSYIKSLTSYFMNPFSATKTKYGYSRAWEEREYYRTGWWTCTENQGQIAFYYENPVYQGKYSIADGNIVHVAVGVSVPAGTKITIKAVRA